MQRIGVTFTEQQKEQIRTMQKSGDILGAQKIILRELESQVGGTAEASADATAKIGNAFKELQESVGNAILPIVEGLVPVFIKLGEVAPAVIANIRLGFERMNRDFQILKGSWSTSQEALFQINRRMGDFTDKLASGSNIANVFAGLMVDLSNKGDAYEGTLKGLIATTGISNDSLREAISILLRGAEQYGLNETQVSNLRRELNRLNLAELMGIKTTGEATETTKAFTKTVEDLRKSQRELVDPVFAAERAIDRFGEALHEAEHTAGTSQEEFEKVTEAMLAAEAAEALVGSDNINATADAAERAAGFLGIANEHLPAYVAGFSSINPTKIERIEAAARTLDKLTREGAIQFDINVTGPTQAELEARMRRVIAKLTREGAL